MSLDKWIIRISEASLNIPSGRDLTVCTNDSASPIWWIPTSLGWNKISGIANLSLFILMICEYKVILRNWSEYMIQIAYHVFMSLHLVSLNSLCLYIPIASITETTFIASITETTFIPSQKRQHLHRRRLLREFKCCYRQQVNVSCYLISWNNQINYHPAKPYYVSCEESFTYHYMDLSISYKPPNTTFWQWGENIFSAKLIASVDWKQCP